MLASRRRLKYTIYDSGLRWLSTPWSGFSVVSGVCLITQRPNRKVFELFKEEKVNKPPTAEPLSVTTKEDTPTSITLTGSDSDEDPLTYSVITEPTHGRLTGTVPNLNYSPERDFNGQDSFTFEVSDGKVDSAAATVSITVTPGNDPPTANDDSATAQEDTPIVTIDVLKNDTDPDKDRLVVINATQGRNGSVTINTDSTLTYAPGRNFSGNDSLYPERRQRRDRQGCRECDSRRCQRCAVDYYKTRRDGQGLGAIYVRC